MDHPTKNCHFTPNMLHQHDFEIRTTIDVNVIGSNCFVFLEESKPLDPFMNSPNLMVEMTTSSKSSQDS